MRKFKSPRAYLDRIKESDWDENDVDSNKIVEMLWVTRIWHVVMSNNFFVLIFCFPEFLFRLI